MITSLSGYVSYLAERIGCDRERFVIEMETPGQVVIALENPSPAEVEKMKAVIEEASVSVSISGRGKPA